MSDSLLKQIKKNTALLCASFSSIALLGAAGNVIAAEVETTATSAIEVIEIKGIRGSLTQSLNTKRFSDSVLDSISAEDIGDFPDKNIGDAK